MDNLQRLTSQSIFKVITEGHMTTNAIAQALGFKRAHVAVRMNQLAKRGKVKKIGAERGPSGHVVFVWGLT